MLETDFCTGMCGCAGARRTNECQFEPACSRCAMCQVPDCVGRIAESNVHKPADKCTMNMAGTPTGCNQPEVHHKFVGNLAEAIRV